MVGLDDLQLLFQPKRFCDSARAPRRSRAHAHSGQHPHAPARLRGTSPSRCGACAVRVARLPPPAALPFPLPGVLGSAERPAAGTVAGTAGERRGLGPAPPHRHGASRSSEGGGAAAAEVNSLPFLPRANFPLTEPGPLRVTAAVPPGPAALGFAFASLGPRGGPALRGSAGRTSGEGWGRSGSSPGPGLAGRPVPCQFPVGWLILTALLPLFGLFKKN